MIAFIDDHRDAYGQFDVICPICRVLPIAPFTCHGRVAGRQDPALQSARMGSPARWRPCSMICPSLDGYWLIETITLSSSVMHSSKKNVKP